MLTKSFKNIFYVSVVNCYCICIFKGSNYRFSGVLIRTYFKNSYFNTNISNYLRIEFLELFLYWFYTFGLYYFIFLILIWKSISVYFLWFHFWIQRMKSCKSIILSQHTNYLHKWLVHLLTCLLVPRLFFLLWDS